MSQQQQAPPMADPSQALDENEPDAAAAAVLSDLAELLPMEPAGDAWTFLATGASLHRAPEDSEDLLRTLQARHGERDLIAAGIVQRDAASQLTLHAHFNRPGAPVLIVQDLESGQPVELLMESGLLRDENAISTAGRRGEAVDLGRDLGRACFVAFTLADVAVLRGLGLPATLGTEFAELDLDEAEKLGRQRGIWPCFKTTFGINLNARDGDESSRQILEQLSGRNPDDYNPELFDRLDDLPASEVLAPAEELPPRMMLVAWRPAEFCAELPDADGFGAMRQRLSEFAQFLKWDLADVLV